MFGPISVLINVPVRVVRVVRVGKLVRLKVVRVGLEVP